jgi:enhancing lycopene biosynthesis protein 2
MSKKVAIILSGSGGMDGSESHEAICSLLAIEKEGFIWGAYALDEDQSKVISHKDKKELPEKRNMMAESGRLVHGKIRDLDTLKVSSHDILWIVGGFGAVTSLSDLAEKGPAGSVHPKIAQLIKSFYEAKKTIVGVCIAPSLIAHVLSDQSLKITLGDSGTFDETLKATGHRPEITKSDEYVVDQEHMIFSTPAYMNNDCTALKILTACEKITRKIAQYDRV